jgi:outer membrane receptor protein involved in Fe transport
LKDQKSGTVLVLSGYEPFCVWAEEDEMKILIFTSLFCFLTIPVSAQSSGKVQGRVLPPIGRVTAILPDAPDPIKNAQLKLVSAENGDVVASTYSDGSGNFAFENVPDGNYFVVVACNYCAEAKVSTARIAVRGGAAVETNLQLPEQGINETVTISADQQQPIEAVSKSVNIISGQEMRNRADITLADSLRTIPGFRVQQLGGFGRTASIKSRGLRNQDTAILIDGVRFRDAGSITGDATPFLSDITLTSVNRVEVLRGPGSSLYGTNAVGGTIDLQTPVPQKDWHGQVSGALGGLGMGRFRGNISNATDDGKFGFNAAVSRTVFTKGIDGNDDANNTNFQSRVEINPTQRTNISTRFFVSDAFVKLNSNPDTAGTPPSSNFGVIDAVEGVNFIFDADDPDATQRSRSFNGQVAVTHSINSKLSLQGYYSGLTTKRTNDNDILGVGFQSASTSVFEGTIHTANGHIDWSPNGYHRFTAGYEFELEEFRNEGFAPSGTEDFFTDASQSSSTIYVQDLVSLLDGRLQFAGGFRAQFFGLDQPGFSLANAPYSNLSLEDPPAAYTFDGSASYFFSTTRTKLRAHAGNGYRVPSLYERFGTFFNTFPTNSFVALGDPGLKPERTAAFDAGIDQYLWSKKVSLSATYFYTDLVDMIGFGNFVPDIGSTPRPFGGYENQKGGVARGVELSGEIKPASATTIFASYTYTNSDQLVPQVFGSGVYRTLGVPTSQVTLNFTQRFANFWVNADFLGTSSYLAPIFSNFNFNSYVYRFEGNRRLDLTAGYTFFFDSAKYNLRVFGTLENLFDHEYYENGFRTAGITGRMGVAFAF